MAFNSKITNLNRYLQAINWYKNYYYGTNKEIYLAIAGTTAWTDDTSPDTIDASITELTELIGIKKATVDFVEQTVASGYDIVYSDGTYWNKISPNNPLTEDYDNIISNEIKHLYIEAVINYNTFTANTFRKISVNSNPLENSSGSPVCSNDSYNAADISDQGIVHLISHSSAITITSGETCTIGLIMEF